MKTASFLGVILPQTPVHLVQILNSIFQWGDFNPGTLTFNPNSMKISNWTTSVANQMKNDLDWPGFTRFVAKIYQSQITRFWGKILNSNFRLCKKIDISQLWFLGGYELTCRVVYIISDNMEEQSAWLLNNLSATLNGSRWHLLSHMTSEHLKEQNSDSVSE